MKYLNAAEVLPEDLLMEVQKHIKGEFLYIPSGEDHIRWGEKNGSRSFFETRNRKIKQDYENGLNIEQISHNYGLAFDTIRKIVYKK